jgi:DNA repair photolyase
MEPRTSPPAARLSTIRALALAGIPVGVLVAPTIPGFTDHEMPSILQAAAEAGARYAGYEMLRLPYAVAPLFEDWLARNFPLKKDKVLNSIRAVRDGKLNDPRFGSRMSGEGTIARHISKMFKVACRRAGLNTKGRDLSIAAFRRPEPAQLPLGL